MGTQAAGSRAGMVHCCMPSRELKLRRPDTCVECGASLDAGVRAWWDAENKAVTCLDCRATAATATAEPAAPQAIAPTASTAPPTVSVPPPTPVEPIEPAPIDRGEAGRSIEREYERRRANREHRTRESHPVIGGALLAFQKPPQNEEAFKQGAAGERQVAATLVKRVPEGAAEFLHNRRMPGGRGDIDHIAVSGQGVWVIDAKALHGKARIERPLFGEPKLTVKGRNRTKLLDGLDRQVAAVRAALAAYPDVEIFGILCFTDATLPLIGRQLRGHWLLHPIGLAKSIRREGGLDGETRAAIARVLADALPPA